jgi:hypothetical protein
MLKKKSAPLPTTAFERQLQWREIVLYEPTDSHLGDLIDKRYLVRAQVHLIRRVLYRI